MNRAPINGFALNGNIYRRLMAEAGIAVETSLPITYGIGLSGAASISLEATGEAYKRSYATAGADVEVEAGLLSHAVPASMGEGLAAIVVDGDIAPHMIMQPWLDAGIQVSSELVGYSQEGTFGRGTAAVRVESELISYVKEAPYGSGLARFRVESRLAPHVGRSGQVVSTAQIRCNAGMYANLRITEGGQAVVEVAGSGQARIGDRHQLSGKGAIAVNARGGSSLWHHVHAEGKAAIIELRLTAERYGLPAIPTEYTPARPDWQFMVPRDDWHFVVPRDNWGRQ